MNEPKEPILNHWYRALYSPLGVELVVADPEGVRARLYAARKAAQDVDLEAISITSSPFDPQRLWLIKREEKK